MSPMMLYIFCYCALVIFIVGLIVRAGKIASLPVHLRWELAPVPHEKGKSHYGGSYLEEFEWWSQKREKSLMTEAWYMFQEIFFLKGVWEHNRKLWIFSLPFHQGLYFAIGMMFLFIVSAVMLLPSLQNVTIVRNVLPIIGSIAWYMGWIAYILGIIGTIGLFLSRILDPKLRHFASFASYFNLVFLAALFASGCYAIVSLENFTSEMTAFWHGALTANFQQMPLAISVHMAICMAFLVYLPFTYMMHFVAKYFTYHKIRWDDNPMEANSKLEKKVTKLLEQPVTWSAEHINADGKKNWVDIATEETGK